MSAPAAKQPGIAGGLADTAADGTRGRSNATTRLITIGADQPASGDVRVIVADGRAAVGANGDGIGVVAKRCAVEAVHGAASSAG
jgi:hypothetical protein